MQMLRSLCWMLFGVGLTLFLANDNQQVQGVGRVLMFITLMLRLLIYLREHAPSWERINAVGEPKLSILETVPGEAGLPAQSTPVVTPMLSSPVQRLLDEDR
jgi:hypothetical protein